MTNKFLKLTALGLVLVSTVLLLGCLKKEQTEQAEDEKTETLETDEFENIDISIASASIILKPGDKYSISYCLQNSEKVAEVGVVDKTLILKTEADKNFKPDLGKWEVIVTVPPQKELDNLILKTSAGNVFLKDKSFKTAEVRSVSGNILVENSDGRNISVHTTDGSINFLKSNMENISAKNVSSDISFKGNFKNIEAESTSGSLFIDGKVDNTALLKTVSGRIETNSPFSTIKANSVGGISYKGERQGKKMSVSNGLPKVNAKSVSGRISIL